MNRDKIGMQTSYVYRMSVLVDWTSGLDWSVASLKSVVNLVPGMNSYSVG